MSASRSGADNDAVAREPAFKLSPWTGGQASTLLLASVLAFAGFGCFLGAYAIWSTGPRRISDYLGLVILPAGGCLMGIGSIAALRTALVRHAREVVIRSGLIFYPYFFKAYSGTLQGGKVAINDIRRISIEKPGSWLENPLRATVVRLETGSGDFALLRGLDRPAEFAALVESMRTSRA